MNPGDQTRPYSGVNEETTARLLRLALVSAGHSADGLVSRIESTGGQAWFDQALRSCLCGADQFDALIDGTVSLSQLHAMKDEGKRRHAADGGQQRLIGSAGYFAALAAGFAYHNTSIGSYARDELEETFLTIASVLTQPWSELFQRAALPGRWVSR